MVSLLRTNQCHMTLLLQRIDTGKFMARVGCFNFVTEIIGWLNKKQRFCLRRLFETVDNRVFIDFIKCIRCYSLLHCESKKGDTILLSISLLNFDRFS